MLGHIDSTSSYSAAQIKIFYHRTDEGERCRRELGKYKGSTQITEVQLLEEPKLSFPSVHGSQTFFHGQLTTSLSLLILWLHLNDFSACQGDGCDELMGWVVFTSLSLALPDVITANPEVKEGSTSCTAATACISRSPATGHLEHHQPLAEVLLHLLLVPANPAFLHDGFHSPPGVHPSCGCSFDSFDSCGQACREETLPTHSFPWRYPMAEAQQARAVSSRPPGLRP